MAIDTLPKLLKRNYERYGDKKVAMRRKDLGVWHKYTWEEYYEKVKYFSLGLVSLGLEAGDKLAITGDNDPEWYWAELAVQAAGGVAVGIFTDAISSEARYIIEHSDSSFVVARDQEQVDKILVFLDELPQLNKIIYWDVKGLWSYDEPRLISFKEVVEMGREFELSHPGFFEQAVEQSKEGDVALIAYTSGTTSERPKAAIRSQRSLIRMVEIMFEVTPYYSSDNYLSFTPPAWAWEQLFGLTGTLLVGATINFAEEPETVTGDMREIAPNILPLGARFWESIASTVQAKMSDANALKRFCYHLALPVGYKIADFYFAGEKPDLLWRAAYQLARWAVFRPLTDKHGIGQARLSFTAGAPLSPDAFRFFAGIGVELKQLYALTETGFGSGHKYGEVKPESVGAVMPQTEVRISDDDEITIKSEGNFEGYYKDAEMTSRVLVDGWVHTGDAGHIDDDGHLIYYDRVADMVELASGARFAPAYIEGRLRFSPYIRDAMVTAGEDKSYVTAIINIDFETVGKWAEDHRLPYTTFIDLSQKPEIYELTLRDIERVNHTLPDAARVRKYCHLSKEFDADEAELTRTRKLRRGFMEQRYGYLINAMYAGKTEITAESEVKYRDGRKGMIQTSVRLKEVT